MFDMARSEPSPSIADLLDEAAAVKHEGYGLKLDSYLDSLDPEVAERVKAHLCSDMSARKIATTITNDPTTTYSISGTAVQNWRERYCVE